MPQTQNSGRPLREGVGRNSYLASQGLIDEVALYARAWVEISKLPSLVWVMAAVALYARAWVEIGQTAYVNGVKVSPSTRGRG